ncbi:hypothetical protein ASPVEDRAFT_121582 [Aspergillus versicolor CBS 583.65]|uniref:Amino acid permease/ SLC12A domain-containing protein n=1 Tax=Aspergillus versicolor CBS 583.65 TaxID=1036611 RepID=A0A1L9P5F8_ASPVE|nr:uncharacterized protein ASPVEDRAFT_121582 [Aspergillus versicolor CBS 583.65]OJI96739.1 hypothetical protein ASPVEDRAFT_121582 [Aspergillus versicolor CBS 583.65]
MQNRFSFWSLLGYQLSVMSSWANYLVTVGVSVDIGGPVGFLYGTLIVGFFQQTVVLSLAEMASAWPHAGGPEYWALRLSPVWAAPFLTYITGYLNLLAYLTAFASAGLSSTQTISAVIANVHGFHFTPWQMCLLYWGVSIFCITINLLPRLLPAWNIMSMAWLLGALVVTIGVWVSHIDAQSAHYVFTEFVNHTGWDNSGIVFVLSLTQTVYAMTGIDAVSHLADEANEPRRTIPLVLVISVLLSTIFCFGFAILLPFSLGPFDSLVNSTLGEIYVQLFVNGLGLKGGLAVSTLVMLPLNLFCGSQLLTASSRLIWALASQRCIPLSKVLVKINKRAQVPVRAIVVSYFVSMLLGLLYVVSDTAWNAIASCVAAAYQATYIAPLALLLCRGRSLLPPRYFSMDRFRIPFLGYAVNVLALLWCAFVIVISCFPLYLPIRATTMNYTVAVLGIWLIGVLAYWFMSSRSFISSNE